MAASVVARSFNTPVKANGFWLQNKRNYGIRVINKTGSTIAANKLVAISGYDTTSKHVKIVPADADSANLATDVYVTQLAIKDGNKGRVYKGFLSTADQDTSGVTTVGDAVYLDTVAGGFTATAPSAGNAMVVLVGYAHVKSSTVGQIFWDVQPPQKIGSGQIQTSADGTILVATGSISAANIIGTSAGQLGHATGVIMVAAGGASVINQLVYCIVENDFLTAAYTAGGNLSVNIGAGGAALTGVAANTVWCTNSADVSLEFLPLAATKNTYTLNNPLNLVSSVAPTNPGTAAGVIKWKIGYRAITSQLD